MTAILRVAARLAVVPNVVAAAALFVMMIMTFADVIGRSVFSTPIEAATELTRLLMAVVVFSVLPVVSARGAHIAVDLLDPFFHGLAQRLRDGAVNIGCGLMLIWPALRAHDLAERARSYGDVTEYLGIPQFYPGWFIAVMAGVAALALIGRGIVALVAPRALVEAEGVL